MKRLLSKSKLKKRRKNKSLRRVLRLHKLKIKGRIKKRKTALKK